MTILCVPRSDLSAKANSQEVVAGMLGALPFPQSA